MYPFANEMPGLQDILAQMNTDYQADPQGSPIGQNLNANNDLQSAVNSIFSQYQPQHQFSDMLAQMIQGFPQRAPEPTGWRKLLAGVASMDARPEAISGGQPIGFTGANPKEFHQNYDELTQNKFHDSLNDWMAKVKPVEVGAQDERYNNANQRMLLNSEASRAIGVNRAQTAATNADSLDRSRRASADAAGERNRIAQERQATYAQLAQLKLPDTVKIQLQEQMREQYARLDRALQMGNTREAIRLRGEIQGQMIQLQGEVTKGVNADKAKTTADKPDTPRQFTDRVKNNGVQAALTHPDWVTNGFINADGTMNLENIAAADDITHKQIIQEIYGPALTEGAPANNTSKTGDISLDTGKTNPPAKKAPANVTPKTGDKAKDKVFIFRSKKNPNQRVRVPEVDASKVDPNLWEFVSEAK